MLYYKGSPSGEGRKLLITGFTASGGAKIYNSMANKREFKKYVEAVGASACEAMMSTYYNVVGVDKKAVSEAINDVMTAVVTARAKSNVFFDKGHKAFESAEAYTKAKQEFFKKLFTRINDDFAADLDAALKKFNAAIPQSVKEDNKKAAAE